jgi:radical SAM protein with 4Fe4S-binding SPASM domain
MTNGYHIIKVASPALTSILGKQKYEASKEYRISCFTIMVNCEGGILYHSCLTGELIIVTDETISRQYLIERWFYVLVNVDEKLMLPNIKNLLRCLSKKQKDGYKTFEIITTTSCNANCYYCYELGFKHMTLNEETAGKVIEFIDKNRYGNNVKIKWYGGEPLMNMKAIDIISEGLLKKRLTYSSTMISNGLLFSEEVISKANKLWNLRNVRITLDGTEKTYNETKKYKKCADSPFQIVLKNIDNLLAEGISVTIRLNIEKKNMDDVKKLINYLCKKYKDNFLLDFMLRPLNNTNENKQIESVGINRDSVLNEITLMKEKLFSDGFFVNCGKLTGLTLCSCIADSGKYIAIKPNGDLVYCSSDFDKKNYGSVYNDSRPIPFPELSKQLFEKKAICDDCPLFAICSPSKLCPACIKPICNETQKVYNIEDVKLTMKKEYRIYKVNKRYNNENKRYF